MSAPGTRPAAERTGDDIDRAIAVVGMSCRLPGADNPDAFWQLLRAGRDALGTPWPDRGEAAAGVGEAARRGGFLEDVAGFDAAFFGIAPREAAVMDPQQRLALELAWEAMESAGAVPARLRGTRTGVFAGAMWDDYAALAYRDGVEPTPNSLTGGHRGMIANRLSFSFGLTGPSLVADTGQSSSLVAVHLAMRSLRAGECEAALVVAVNLNLLPERVLSTERFGGLSPDGVCHTFDAAANGYARGEGGVCLLLKPLSRALADGDRVVGVLRGSAVNNDGGGRSLTDPDARAQAAVLHEAYRDAGVDPAAVRYVELHGTGTRAGDPVEAAALGEAAGAADGRTEPLQVGSVKTNIGHLEAAAGLAGLLKVLLCVDRGELVAGLNFRAAPEDIPLDRLNLRVRTEAGPWPEGPRLAGVSAWGMGGTNCHVVVAGPPSWPAGEQAEPGEPAAPFVLSARDPQALRETAGRLAERLADGPDGVASALVRTRTAFAHRAVLLTGPAELRAQLGLLAEGEPAPGAVTGVATERGGTVFVFPGQGAQWDGMAGELYRTSRAFRESIDQSASALGPYVDWSLLDVVTGAPGAASLDRVDVVQPVLFAVMVGLAALWRELGVHPDAVAGHSQGEIAAAYVAGALDLDDAARIVALRSRALRELAGTGGMVSVALGAEEVDGWLARLAAGGVEVAAVNGPAATVVSGERAGLERLVTALTEAGVRARWIQVDYASHAAGVEPLAGPLTAALAGIRPRSATTAFYSTVTGERIDTTALGADYWYGNLRRPVRFAPAVQRLIAEGHHTFVEMSPHPVLVGPVQDTADGAGEDVVTVGSLRRGEGGLRRLLTSAAQAYVRGLAVDWTAVVPRPGGPPARLPTYPFQRRRYWLDTFSGGAAAPEAVPANDSRSLLRTVRAAVAGTLGYSSADDIDPARTFKELGLDSAMAVDLRGRLAVALGVRATPAMIFDHPTPARLARHLGGATAAPEPEESVAASGEPVAIVAMACRFPGGVDSPEALWRLLAEERDAITPFPENRGWDLGALFDPDPDRPGTTYARAGGFLHDADRFDAGLFGISAREALAMDPQQRLLLQTGWEALERAGIAAEELRGTRTGVFMGVMSQQYGPRLSEAPPELGGHLLTGGSVSVASGRLAYVLGLEGPALTVDTACSSSLVAMHLARASLLAGECTTALVGGACVMTDPGLFTEFSRQRGLAPDGRCKPFAAAADGTAWAEGAAVLVLERLSEARRKGHPVLALLRGSAVNSDGASNGLAAPNGPAQQRVIRQALASAGLRPADVDAVEAHGTGTRLGDPIEAGALLATYGAQRPADRPLWLGSIKSNIGHAQAAAGMAGVIKMVMAMRHGTLPATLHVDEPTPFADWTGGAVRLLTAARPWPAPDHPRRAGVSSFGISGTNAHVVLEHAEPEQEQEPEQEPEPEPGVVPWPLSANDPAALTDHARRLAGAVAGLNPRDVAATLARRTALAYRAVVTGRDEAELTGRLEALAAGGTPAGVAVGTVAEQGRVVFVFPGQGTQWQGMAVRLLAESEPFARQIAACERALRPHVDWSLTAVLRGEPGAPPPERVDVVQPALFAVMVALAELWRTAGVTPDAVAGHSQGEIAAAYVAGALSLEDAARVVALRGKALRSIAGSGAMASIGLPAAEVADRLGDGGPAVAALNGPTSTVVAGDAGAVRQLVEDLTAEGVRARLIPVDYASHSAGVEPLRDLLHQELASIEPRSAPITFLSTVTAEAVDTSRLDAGYWYRNLREPVRFQPAVSALHEDGHTVFVEVSPHPVLVYGIQETLDEVGRGLAVGTLRRDEGGLERFLASAGELYVAGVPVDWSAFGAGGRRVDLPTYPFRTDSYWLTAPGRDDPARLGLDRAAHPLLGAEVDLPDGGRLHTGRLGLDAHPWLAGHHILGTAMLPAAAFVDLVDSVTHGRIEELTLEAPLRLRPGATVALQAGVGAPDETGRRTVVVRSRDGSSWTRHGTAVVTAERPPEPGVPAGAWPPEGAREVDLEAEYGALAEAGFPYAGAFRGVRRAWAGDAMICAEVELDDDRRSDAPGYGLHPALLDAAAQTVLLGGGTPALPFAWTDVVLYRPGATVLRVRATRLAADRFSLLLTDPADRPVAVAGSLLMRPPAAGGTLLHRLDWVEAPAGAPAGPPGVVLRGPDRYGLAGALGEPPAAPEAATVLFCPDPCVDEGTVAERTLTATHRLLDVVQEWLGEDRQPPARLVIVTSGAVDGPIDPVQAAMWGLIRTARTEHPGAFALLDVDGPVPAETLRAALAVPGGQAAVRGGRVRVPRLNPVTGDDLPPVPDGPWRLENPVRGTLDTLRPVPCPEAAAPLAEHEIRVAVRAAGMNFRDVLNALGLYPGEAGALGLEGAGVVLETGAGVRGLRAGDRVMGLMRGSYGPTVVTDHRLVVPIPAGWSFGTAASVPVAYLTAYHALVGLAALRPGESLLVHAAAGGVGTAAVQLGLHLGARVYGTAAPAKWPALRAAGLPEERIASSRDLGFEDRLRAAAGPAGIDVVLNALAGDFVDASLRLLAPGGRFVEMGKTDPRDPAQVAEQHRGVHYAAFDLTELPPEEIQRMLRAVLDLFAEGGLRPPPVRFADVRRAPELFRSLSQGGPGGKLVLTVPARPGRHGTVLVTGGTGGLGLVTARHLAVEHGLRRLLLLSRSGAAGEGAAATIAELTAAGVDVDVVACDVADRASLARALARIPAEHPLTAVVHAAGVLDDAVVTAQDRDRLAAVMAPKTRAAWHLHELTQDLDLAEFVLFSSVVGVLGGAGQANYAAANASLDALASVRRAQGRPARSLAWGLWAEASGMTGRMTDRDRERMRQAGVAPMSTAAGLAAYDLARDRDEAVLVAARLDRAPAPPAATPSRPEPDLAGRLRAMSTVERGDYLVGLVREHAAAVLGRGGRETVTPGQSFRALGFDSLTSVELRNRLSRAAGLRLPASAVFDFPTLERLAGRIGELLIPPRPSPPPSPPPAAGDGAPAGDIDEMDAEALIVMALSANPESEHR
ncbi:type I polyketide synthase [Actinoplanes sp. NPDC048796]|uniref:type I polyketide synthase n=1 Tax=Actinoplanes sp. NPDC048796 TaxID=3155640 RepID=UPI0033C7E057